MFYDPDPLAVGDRVRVRLSGECRYTIPADPALPGDTDYVEEHDAIQHGLTGVIDEVEEDGDPDFGHPYWVAFDRPYPRQDGLIGGRGVIAAHMFARVELERL